MTRRLFDRPLLAWLLLVPLIGGACLAHRPDRILPDAARVARVEAGLLPPARVRGRSYPPARIEARMRALGVPAVSIAVIDSGRVVWARAYGLADVATRRPATPATLFQAASMSKPVAATAALQLVAEGRLALDEEANARLKSWKVPANEFTAQRPVTLRGLLTHTAGLTVHGFGGYTAGAAVPTVVQLLDGAAPANSAPVRVDTEPGKAYRYSGGGITVMQLLLSDVTGQSFSTLLRERVLGPAGMTESTFEQPLPASRMSVAATGYRRNGEPIAGNYHTYPEMAAAGLWTTPTDLARWVIAVQRSLAGARGGILTPAMATAMVTPAVGGWGLGVALGGAGDTLRFEHGGANAGFQGNLVGFARGGRGAVVMTNSDVGGALAREIIQAVATEYGWSGYAPQEIVPTAVAPGALRAYAGHYALTGTPVRVTVAVRDGQLELTQSGTTLELVPTGPDTFTPLTGGGTLRFARDTGGNVTALVAGATRLERVP